MKHSGLRPHFGRQACGPGWMALACAGIGLISGCATMPQSGGGTGQALPLANPGFELPQGGNENCPRGWSCSAHADPTSFRFSSDRATAAVGGQSLMIERVKSEPWAMVSQLVDARPLGGKTVVLRAKIRTADLHDVGVHGAGGGLILHAMEMPGDASFQQRLISENGDWRELVAQMRVPPGTRHLRVGAVLEGGGKLWVDEMVLHLPD